MTASLVQLLQNAANEFQQHTASQPQDATQTVDALQTLVDQLKVAQDTAEPGSDAAAAVDATSKALGGMFQPLQDAIDNLEACINSQPEALRKPKPPNPSGNSEDSEMRDYVADCKRTLSYAHRISYNTFAPPGHQLGTPLGLYKPPAPQEYQIVFSLLHQFAGEVAQMAQQAALAAPPAQAPAAHDLEAAFRAALAREGLSYHPGMPLPPPPPGWKPGDPIQLPQEVLAQLRTLLGPAGAPQGAPQEAPEPPVAEPKIAAVDHGLLLDVGAVLEEASGDDSSVEDSSDDDSE